MQGVEALEHHQECNGDRAETERNRNAGHQHQQRNDENKSP